MLEFWSGFIFYLMVDIRISWSKSHKKQSKEKRINLPPKPNRRKRESKPEAQTLVTARNHIWTRRNRWCTEQQTEEPSVVHQPGSTTDRRGSWLWRRRVTETHPANAGEFTAGKTSPWLPGDITTATNDLFLWAKPTFMLISNLSPSDITFSLLSLNWIFFFRNENQMSDRKNFISGKLKQNNTWLLKYCDTKTNVLLH